MDGYPVFDVSDVRRAVYAGSIVYNLGFGCYLLLTITSIYMLWHQPRTPSRQVLLPYASCMLVVNTAFFALNVIVTEAWSQLFQNGSFPTEDPEYANICGKGSISLQVLRTVPVLLNDLLFLYRAFHILGRAWKTLAGPCLLYAVLLLLGLLSIIHCPLRSGFMASLMIQSTNIMMGFIGASIALNLLLTILITRKLRGHSKMMYEAAHTGNRYNEGMSDPYTAIITIVVESAAAWTVAALAFLTATAIQSANPVSPFDDIHHAPVVVGYFLEYVFQITVPLSPAVLILRVAFKKHFATPEELRTWEASRSCGRDLESHDWRLQTMSASGGPRPRVPPPRSLSALRFETTADDPIVRVESGSDASEIYAAKEL